MLGRIITIAILVLVTGWLAGVLVNAGGVAVIEWFGYRIEARTSLLVALAIGFMVLVLLLDRGMALIMGLPGRMRARIMARRAAEGQQALALGLIAASIGDTALAAKQARRARRLAGATTLTGLLDAQISSLTGDTAAAGRFFASLSNTGNRNTRWLGHASTMRLAAEAGDSKAALAAGRAAFAMRPNDFGIARGLFVLEAGAGNWREAIEALKVALAKSKSAPKAERAELTRAMAALNYELGQSRLAADDEKAALDAFLEAVRHDPAMIPAALEATRLLAAAGKTRKAIAIASDAFIAAPHPELARRLMDMFGGATATRFARLLRLVEKGGNSTAAVGVAGGIAASVELWGEARRLGELVPEAERDALLWTVLAEVGRNPPDAPDDGWPNPDACMQKAAGAPRAPGWLCRQCGAQSNDWKTHCPECGGFASLAWRKK